jgi:hypothetical protein
MDKEIRSLKDVEALFDAAKEGTRPTTAKGIDPSRFRLFCDITRKIIQMDSLQDLLEEVLDAAILLTGAERGFFDA